jgi:ADP-ribose pyrophosphatase YjhB (NUDIX family)
MAKTRAVALGIVEQDGKILVEEMSEETATGTEYFYRPPGGGIDYAEYSRDAVVREFREELDAEVRVHEHLACLEHIWNNDGHQGHEIVQLYHVEFADKSFYERDLRILDDGETDNPAVWVPLDDFVQDGKTLFPTGLAELLAGRQR